MVQLREKTLTDAPLTGSGRACSSGSAPTTTCPSCSTTDPALAAAIGADGVHVGQEDMAPARPARLVGDDAIVGLSTHAPAELDRRRGTGGRMTTGPAPAPLAVDYISAGPVVAHADQAGPARHRHRLRGRGVRRAPWPVWVTGGVDPDHGGRPGGGRRPALRGGPLAHRGDRPQGQRPGAPAGDRRGDRRGTALTGR